MGRFLVILCLLCGGAAYAGEAPLTPREKALLEMVQKLEARVTELEQRLDAQPQSESSASLNDRQEQKQLEVRVEKLEEEVKKEVPASNQLTAYWKKGLRLESEDKAFSLRVGGRIQTDWAFFDQERSLRRVFGNEDDGTEFRRVRVNLQGTLYKDFLYRVEYDVAGDDSDPNLKDVYVALRNLPYVGKLQVGHFREAMGLERLTSSSYAMFMERALPNALLPGRNMGVQLSDAPCGGRLTWALGLFKEVDDFPSDDDSDSDQGYSVTGRITGLPWYAEEGRKLLHLGASYSHRNSDGAKVRYRSRPESHLAMNYLDTSRYPGFTLLDARADDMDLYGLELALLYGPFSLQSEYMSSHVDTTFNGDLHFDGYYVQAGYFLTGEHQPYKKAGAVFNRVQPNANFSLTGERGWGAWQLALRYSNMDLDAGLVRGGSEEDVTVGLNWHLNSDFRVMLNYVMADIEHDLYSGSVNTLQTRFQVDF